MINYKQSILGTFLIVIFIANTGHAQERNFDFSSPVIASATLHPEGLPTFTPMIPLDGGKLTLRFDDLEADYKSYNARIVHCTHDWFESDLYPSQYIDGFYDVSISDMEDSFGTMVEYTHYRLDLPTVDMVWTISGNYILEVFEPSAPETVVLRKRFVVYEDLCGLEASVSEPVDIGLRRTHQEIGFTITESGYSLVDPYSNLVTAVMQNGRWDNIQVGKAPRFVKGRELDFTQVGYVFPGGNAYRFADLKSLSFTAMGVAGIQQGKHTWHHLLEESERRTYKYHSSKRDINGRYVISNDRFEEHTGSDYTKAHFTLPMPYKLQGRDVYIFGDLSDGRQLGTHKMIWNADKSAYEGTLLLKQGYYDFLYLVEGQTADIEGDHFATNNLYTVFVYYADFEGYDRVIGFTQWQCN